MSVSANGGGTGRVARNELCFGGLGQLYRVKVWAVSGHNISQQPAVRCLTPDGQCREGKGGMQRNVVFWPTVELVLSMVGMVGIYVL